MSSSSPPPSPSCRTRCCKRIDSFLEYDTTEVVRIRSRYLGLLYYSMILAIILYIVIYVLIIQKRYLDHDTPIGTVVTSILQPQNGMDPSRRPYCLEYNATLYGAQSYPLPLNCEVWDALEARHPTDVRGGMFVTTRVTRTYEIKQCVNRTLCNSTSPWIPDPDPSLRANTIYLSDIGSFTMRVLHQFQAPIFYRTTGNTDFTGASAKMQGYFDTANDGEISIPENQVDIYRMDELFRYAGVNMDALANFTGVKVNETWRYSGLVLLFQILYTNDNGPNIYRYKVSMLPETDYKILQPIYTPPEVAGQHPFKRMQLNRHGVKIIFIQGGRISKFEIQTLFVQCSAALGLFSLATLIVDLIMLRLMPQRKAYRKAAIQYTRNLNKQEKKAAKRQENEEKQQQPQQQQQNEHMNGHMNGTRHRHRHSSIS